MHEKTGTIRELISNARTQEQLMENEGNWFQVCSSIDVIEDTQLAIDFFNQKVFNESDGEKYLYSYGILQALYLQQDAVSNLCEALSIPFAFADYPKLQEIREVRNETIGHPTKRDKRKDREKSYHFISRVTMSKNGFQLMTNTGEETYFKYIDFKFLIDIQKDLISSVLNKVIVIGEEGEKEHKEKFIMDKLVNVFDNNSNYYFQKVFESVHNHSYVEYGEMHYNFIKEMIKNYESKLLERGIKRHTYMGIEHALEYTDYIISRLDNFFISLKKRNKGDIDSKEAYIFVKFLEDMFEDLRESAVNIDKDYNDEDTLE